MSLKNTDTSFGTVARGLHWATAGLILVAWPLGLWAEGLPHDSAAEVAFKAQMFSVHKTLGVAAFFVGLVRILWALGQRHPAPVNPDHRLEVWMAAFVHWLLYGSLILVPLTGWIYHAATEGFAPILWPLGQGLPFVPKSEAVAHVAGAAHWLFTKLILVAVVLHVAGALKHAVIDRDGTLQRMLLGRAAGAGVARRMPTALVAALAVFGLGGLALLQLPPAEAPGPVAAVAQGAGNWQVQEGTLGISVRQMGSAVAGSFAAWTADIRFDPAATSGNRVEVAIDLSSLQLGSVSSQAKGPEFLNAEAVPGARFAADIRADGAAWVAEGVLDLNGAQVPVTLPFALDIQGDQAVMTGETQLDRRDFGIGAKYADETTVGFGVTVTVKLTATRR